jgi:hypothetical protein
MSSVDLPAITVFVVEPVDPGVTFSFDTLGAYLLIHPSKQVTDHAVGVVHVGLGPGQSELAAEVFEHEINVSTEGVGYNRRRLTHTQFWKYRR